MRACIPAVILCLLAACSSDGDLANELAPAPEVVVTITNPTELAFEGGTVTVNATIASDNGVDQAWVEIRGDNATLTPVDLDTTADGAYRADVTLPANLETTTAEWRLDVAVRDRAGKLVRSGAGTISVGTVRRPPAPPTP